MQTPIDEVQFQGLVHKVKGGAQLLQATQFIHDCQVLELNGPISERIEQFIALLEKQNQIIRTYKKSYQQ